ncbi:unnamed protein product [Prorocentrum cordatum]|uniref:Uncharacterized protein n=1 Tax=Prorocentrum cordatum TaxID=2364126 RepID=A0ABN9Y1A6_9DINO|nr:unnamed protein product [Polarella glacialis]
MKCYRSARRHLAYAFAGVASRRPSSRQCTGLCCPHCGGPFPTMSCVISGLDFDHPVSNVRQSFDLLGLKQRGMNPYADVNKSARGGFPPCPFKQDDGEPVKEYPVAACDEVERKTKELRGDDFTFRSLVKCSDFEDWFTEVLPGYAENASASLLTASNCRRPTEGRATLSITWARCMSPVIWTAFGARSARTNAASVDPRAVRSGAPCAGACALRASTVSSSTAS